MSKYIDADKLKRHYAWWDDEAKKIFDEIIDLQPAADVQEVQHGRWVDVEPAPHNLFYATCSVCGDRQTIEVANYCPMCGASMDEVKE